MNTFIKNLEADTNFDRTANGALTHKSTLNKLYDMFALGGAYRNRSDEDCILLFKQALEENVEYALKCLFYLRDCRGGQGERRFFRICFKWLCNTHPTLAHSVLDLVPEYGRWDDLIYATISTPLWVTACGIIKTQLQLDATSKTPSLLAKWVPSENASSKVTKAAAKTLRKQLGATSKQYRKMLSELRKRINIVERLMSENRWDEIEFDKIPSKAGLIYRNAFARRDILKAKYEAFIKSDKTKVNADTLYPYEIVEKIRRRWSWFSEELNLEEIDRLAINKYWENLPDYLDGADNKILCVIDTSGSMLGRPMDVAVSLGMYCAERLKGDYHNTFVTFSRTPQFIDFNGVDFCDKVTRVMARDECENTNLHATFELLFKAALKSTPEDRPETIVVISDMQIDYMSDEGEDGVKTLMESEHTRWAKHGLKLPKLVYWNVNGSGPAFLDNGPDVTYVSGASPVIFKQVLGGKTGMDFMFDILDSDRYKVITVK